MASREILWNLSLIDEIVLYVLAAASLGVFAWGILRQVRRVTKGQKVPLPKGQLLTRLGRALVTVGTNRTVFRRHLLAGSMHAMILWAMVALFIATVIVAIEYDLFYKLLGQEHTILQGSRFLVFELLADLFGGLLIVGLLLALTRRYVLRRPQLRHRPVDWIMPVWLLLIAVTGFAVEGLRLAAEANELSYSPTWSPVGAAFAATIPSAGDDTLRSAHVIFWWIHAALALGGIALLPYVPKVAHMISAGVNIFFEDLRPKGRLAPLDVEGAFERDENLGYATLADLTRKDRLDVVACTECGRCEQSCPASNAGKTLSPREIILGLRRQLVEESPLVGHAREPRRLLEAHLSAQAIRDCTTCMACVESCPVFIDPLSKILEIRRNEVMIEDVYPETHGEVFAALEKRNNPWNEHPTNRLDWAKGLDLPIMAEIAEAGRGVDCLFWVGCAAAFDPRNAKIARSMVAILRAAGVDFAVLGEEERCTGDPARRMGHEYLFSIAAETNIELLSRYRFQRILTICPHCYNTFANEYPDYGGQYTVVHHSQLIRDLLSQGRLTLSRPVDAVVTFHDPCYLGRHQRIFDAPREVLESIPGLELVEMDRSREMAMCCGGGGGLTWVEEESGKRVNERRVEQAAECVQKLGGDASPLLATACPFCMTMLEDALASRETAIRDFDIAELLVKAMIESADSEG